MIKNISCQKSIDNNVSTGIRCSHRPSLQTGELSFGESQGWVHESSTHTHTHIHTHSQLKGFITLDNLEAALKYQTRPEARAEHRELWTGRDFYLAFLLLFYQIWETCTENKKTNMFHIYVLWQSFSRHSVYIEQTLVCFLWDTN